MTIEQLNAYRMRRNGETMSVQCPCGGESGWQLACVASSDTPVISGIVCMDCGEEKGVAYGKIGA